MSNVRITGGYNHVVVSLFILLAGVFIFILLYSLEIKSREKNLRRLIAQQTESAAIQIKERLEERLVALDRMAMRHLGGTPQMEEYWYLDAKGHYSSFSGFQAIEWANTRTKLEWIYPVEVNEAAAGLVLNKEGKREKAIQDARKNRRGSVTKLIDLKQGGRGFLSVHPTYRSGEHSGFIVGVYRVADIFSQITDKGYQIEIRFDDDLAFRYGNPEAFAYDISHSFRFRNVNLSFRLGPTRNLIEEQTGASKRSVIPFLIFLFFVVMSASAFLILKSSKRLKHAVKNATDAKDAIDESLIYARTDAAGKIVEVNKKFEEISEYSEAELMGKDHRIINSGTHPKKFFVNLWKTIHKGEVWRGEILNRSKSGRLYWVDTSIIPLKDERGAITGFSALRTEITDKKKVEDELRASRETALSALETKARFLANMSHEIRTPMNGILGLADLLKDKNLDPDSISKVNGIQRSGQMLLKLIDDILDFSKLEAGKVELEVVSVDLRKELKHIVELLEEQASEKGTKVRLEVKSNLPKWLFADPVRVRQIVINFMSNAIKFTGQGSVVLTADSSVTDGTEFVKISVVDSGIGISVDDQEKLFQSFSQVDASTTRRYGGTGLGLSICKGFVDLMGGEIGVSSTQGKGATFCFTFPLKQAETAPDWDDLEQDSSGSEVRIRSSVAVLVAEDNEINRSVVQGYLERLGCNIDLDFAFNGEEAVERASSKKYDIIFMDCNMPVMDGYQATKKIKSFGNPPKIVALTASAMAEDRDRCLQAGMDTFLSKPIRKRDLAHEIELIEEGKVLPSSG